MPLAHGILGLLHYGSMSGYDLSKAFRASVNLFWHAQTSQIYATLDKLERSRTDLASGRRAARPAEQKAVLPHAGR